MNKFQKVMRFIFDLCTLFIPCIVQGIIRMKDRTKDKD